MTRKTLGWAAAFVLVSGALLVAGAGGRAGERPFMRDPDLEALQIAVRWPNPDVSTVLGLTGRLIAAGRDKEAYTYFQERAKSTPDRPLFRPRGVLPGAPGRRHLPAPPGGVGHGGRRQA